MQASQQSAKKALWRRFLQGLPPSPGTNWSMNLNKFAQRAVLYVCVPKGSIMNRAFVVTKRAPKSLSLARANKPKWNWILRAEAEGGEEGRVVCGKTRKLRLPSWCNVWKMLPSRCKLCHLGHKRLQLWRPCVAFHFSRSRSCNFAWPNGLRSHGIGRHGGVN